MHFTYIHKNEWKKDKTKVLTLATTNIALKLKAVETKLEILHLVNPSKIVLKLQHVFNLILISLSWYVVSNEFLAH